MISSICEAAGWFRQPPRPLGVQYKSASRIVPQCSFNVQRFAKQPLLQETFIVRAITYMGVILVGILLAACGAEAPPPEALSAVQARQTAVALQAQPTLAPLPTGAIGQAGPPPTPIPVAELLGITNDDPRALGDPNAPVLIVEFTDFECPFCKRFVEETRPQIVERFVETGVVRFVIRDMPLNDIHPAAQISAAASRCAADQNQFWPMYERLFATHQVEWGGAPVRDREVFIAFAADLGLDATAFTACLDDPATTAEVIAETQAAGSLGINSTPSFLVNGRLVRGALPFSTFERLIVQEAGQG
jgi:protein-disulfide isomerase